MEDANKVRKEMRWFAAVLVGIAAFVLWYIQSPGYYHNRVMTPTLASYYLQLEALKDYRDPGGYIERINIETLDKGKDTPKREITVTIRVQMNGRFDYLTKVEAKEVIRYLCTTQPQFEEKFMHALSTTETYGLWDRMRLKPEKGNASAQETSDL